jgi:hypothetical protein
MLTRFAMLAFTAVLLTSPVAMARTEEQRQVPRGEDTQSPRDEHTQAPRG